MSVCPNCSRKLSCGCQRRVASNGSACCSNCITSLEAKLKAARVVPSPVTPLHKKAEAGITITNISVTSNTPK
jgi:hypothetical protein